MRGFSEGLKNLHCSIGGLRLHGFSKAGKGNAMSLYLSVDVELLEKGLKKLPPLPGLLLHLAWGATMLHNIKALRSFSSSGLFDHGKSNKAEISVYDLAS